MNAKNSIYSLIHVIRREIHRLSTDKIYLLCTIVFPILVTVYFTSMMDQGIPEEMPVGVVDMDNTTTTRKLERLLDAFQTTKITEHYSDVAAARKAMQHGDIYGFIYFPKGTTDQLLASRQPKISFYYSYTSLTAGALIFRDLKTISTLGSAAVGSATMRAKGYTNKQISTFLQPIVIDLHPLSNPWTNYNVYLSTMLIPGCILLFVFLVTAYNLGSELKEGTAQQWLKEANGNIWIALLGKTMPLTIVYLMVFYGYLFYVFYGLGFPHPGGIFPILILGLLTILASQGFGIFLFGLFPSLRMSMSMCSLWSVLSFSMVGTAFPTLAMDPALEVLANLFPLRHYFMIYQISVLGGYPLADVWTSVCALILFAALPLLVIFRIQKAAKHFVYLP